jgi:hypothetical protein
MRQSKWIRLLSSATSLLVFLIVVAVSLGACSAGAATPPLGTYTAQEGSPPDKLTLMDGGRYEHDILLVDLHLVGNWTATQTQMSFTETAGGPCTNVTGTYVWSYKGAALHLTVVNDTCVGRPERFGSAKGWVKQP